MRNFFVIIAVAFLSSCSLDNQHEHPLKEHTWSANWITAIDNTDPYDSTTADGIEIIERGPDFVRIMISPGSYEFDIKIF